MNYAKGDILTLDITDMGINGEGIGKVEGYTLFVKDAVIGDRVKVSIMKAKKGYAYAHLDEVILPSSDRVEPLCPKARSCGGCQLQALSYPAQLRFKQDKVRNDLIRVGGFSEDKINKILKPIVGMDSEFPARYRGKAQFPVGKDKEGKTITGFYAGHSHNIIPIDDCVIGAEEYSRITDIIKGHMDHYGIEPYDEESGDGLIRHILIRKGFKTGEIMVCLVVNMANGRDGKYLTGQDELTEKLAAVKNMTSVSVNFNTGRNNVIMGDVTRTIFGSDVIHDTIEAGQDQAAITYAISPRSFYQVNPSQTDRLYSLVLEYAHLTGHENVWDLYCGTGTISLFLAGRAGHVYGVEIVPEAAEDARVNASSNGIENVTFLTGRAEDIVISGVNSGSGIKPSDPIRIDDKPDVIVVDPPRKGLDRSLTDTILNIRPERLVYVSCDPATLSRDLKILCEDGYDLTKATPVDMFPHSIHVETVCLLERK